jgi:hypothetical protein
MEFSFETRRLIELSRGADAPPPNAERAVRNRLIAELGVAALAGAGVSAAAASVTEAVGATGAGALSGGAPSTAAAGTAAANVAAAVGTTTFAKTVAGLVLVAGLGAGAMQNDAVAERVRELPAQVAVHAERAAKPIWQFIFGGDEERDAASAPKHPLEPALDFDARRHRLLMNIARRPDHPVAKEAELVLILGAEDALSAGDTSLASSYLDRHKARFADGVLSDNREALDVLVHCARGDAEQAKNGARQFIQQFPLSDQITRLGGCAFAAPIVETASPAPSTVAPPRSGEPNF